MVGIGLAVILGLIAVAGLLFFFVFQSQAGPTVTVQQPLSGSQAQVGQPITILAAIKDAKGVSRVEFWVNNALEAMIPSSSPEGQKEFLVQQSWAPDSAGPAKLSLRGINVAGKAGEPFEIIVNVTGSAPAGTPTLTTGATPSVPLVIPTSTTISQPTAQRTPTVLALMPTSTVPSCANNSAFIADVTVPDNSIFPPGATINKIWRLRNSGTCPWQAGYQLVFASGDKMGAPDSQMVVPTEPGGTTDVPVTMYAPNHPGTYKGVWRMVSNTGEAFGQSVTVLIQVPSPNTPTPIVTPTSPAPAPAEAIVQLTADSITVNANSCTTVRASVEHVSAAWLDGEPVVGGYKEKQVCPCNTTTYTLDATVGGQHIIRNVTVNVVGMCIQGPTPTTGLVIIGGPYLGNPNLSGLFASKPDLKITEFHVFDSTPQKGQNFDMSVHVKNVGGSMKLGDKAAVTVGVEETGVNILTYDLNLAAGQEKELSGSYKVETAGSYTAYALVDYYEHIDEADENNNHAELPIEVQP